MSTFNVYAHSEQTHSGSTRITA